MEYLGTDGLQSIQNIDAIPAIFSAGTPQTYSLFCFSPPCLSNQLRLNRNPPLHLSSSSLSPSPTTSPPLPPLSNFVFPLDVCVMTWPSSDRQYSHHCLQKERSRLKCHTDRNNPCDKHERMYVHFLSLMQTQTHTHNHIRNQSE